MDKNVEFLVKLIIAEKVLGVFMLILMEILRKRCEDTVVKTRIETDSFDDGIRQRIVIE